MPEATRRERGQALVMALMCLTVLVLIGMTLLDVAALRAARNWAYRAAQDAALAGVTRGQLISGLTQPTASGACPQVRLAASTAQDEAEATLLRLLALRGLTDFSYRIEVLPDAAGGSVAGFPPLPVRLGEDLTEWSRAEPSVGIFLSFPVQTALMHLIDRASVRVNVFAAAGVAQPGGCS